MKCSVAVLCALTLTLVVGPLEADAQTNSEVNAGIQFDFSLPGARSLSLGGAFVAVADDATAAWGNPAGLTILTRPEVSAESGFVFCRCFGPRRAPYNLQSRKPRSKGPDVTWGEC